MQSEVSGARVKVQNPLLAESMAFCVYLRNLSSSDIPKEEDNKIIAGKFSQMY